MRFKILPIFLLTCSFSFAQRFDNSSNINASFLPGKGIGAVIEYEQLFKRNNTFFLGLNALSFKKELSVPKIDAKLLDTFATFGYRRYFGNKSLFPYFSVAGMIGYEFLTNEKDFSSTIVYNRGDDLIYGITGDIGVEYFIRKVSLFGAFSPIYEFNNKEFYPNARLGIKFYIL